MKRANGTGSVVKLPGSRRRPWAVKIPYHTQRGRVRQRYLSYHERASEAQAALDEWCRTHTAPETEVSGYTLQQVYDLWSAREYPRLGKSSVMSHKAAWNRVSVLASKKMRRITIDDLQGIIDQDERDGLSQSSINNDKLLMAALFRCAMERDIILKDYSQFVRLPSVGTKYEKGVLTDLQLKQLEQLADAGNLWAGSVLILCYTGFRITELLTLTRFSYHTDGDYLQGGVKTAAGRDRIIPVHPKIKPYLSAWLSRGGDYIICKENGAPVRAPVYRAQFRELMEQIGVAGATPHWCRHTFATRLHQAGADELAIKRMMGHSDKDITEHYTHVDLDYLRKELCKVA